MTATIKQKCNRYYIMIDWRQDGQRRQKWVKTPYMVGENCKRKLEQLRLDTLEQYKAKMGLVDNTMLFSCYMQQWLAETKHTIATSTYNSNYYTVHNTISPYFATRKIKLCDLTTSDLQKYYNYRIEVDGVSAQTVSRMHSIIHKALNYAIKTGRLSHNPSDNVELPKKTKHIANYYEVDELKKLLDNISGQPIEPVVRLAAWFGLRRGEIIGLRWDCIDFKRRILLVSGTVKDKGNPTEPRTLYFCDATKTSSSMRALPMPQSAVDYLQSLKADQDERKASNKAYNHTWDDFVCVRDNGDLLPLEYVSRAFPKLCEKAGLRKIKLHELRHTNITILLENGASVRDTSEWAGHSNTSTTLNVYNHVLSASRTRLSTMIDELIPANCNGEKNE